MSQNSMRYSWTFEEVDAKLKGIMEGIYHNVADAAKLRLRGQPRSRRKHRGLPEGGRRDAGPGRLLRKKRYKSYLNAKTKAAGNKVPAAFYLSNPTAERNFFAMYMHPV